MLSTWGATLIVTTSKICAPVRRIYAPLLACPMCFGFWVGAVLGAGGFGPVVAPWWPLETFGDGCAASALCWGLYVVQQRLGAGEL